MNKAIKAGKQTSWDHLSEVHKIGYGFKSSIFYEATNNDAAII